MTEDLDNKVSADNLPQNLNDIDTWDAHEIAALPMGQFNTLRILNETNIRHHKLIQSKMNEALRIKCGEGMERNRRGPYGTSRIEVEEHCVVSKVPKKVVWDQDELIKAIQKMRGLGMSELLDILVATSHKVNEREYKKLSDVHQSFFAEARVITRGTETIDIATPGTFVRGNHLREVE